MDVDADAAGCARASELAIFLPPQIELVARITHEVGDMDAVKGHKHPMWEVFKSPSSIGRGVIGLLALDDSVQPSHDKQDFEHTALMAKIEQKLR